MQKRTVQKIKPIPKNSYYTRNANGFTLIELVIVVAIIALLAGITVAILNPAEYIKQTRDSKRISDIMTIQTTMIASLANNDIALVPTTGCGTCNSLAGTTAVDGTGWIIFDIVSEDGMKTFLQNLPLDQVNDETYNYKYYSDGRLFEINASLESERYQNNSVIDGGNDSTVYERGTSLTIK